MPKGSYEVTGDEKKMAQTPHESPSAHPKSGEFQLPGDHVALGKTPVASPSANPTSGEFQLPGDKVPLNKTPVKGWGSAGKLSMSKRAEEQSKTK